MASPAGRLNVDELVEVWRHAIPPPLQALEVAIHLEDILNVVLPDEVLNEACLGTPSSVKQTLARLLEDD